MKESSDAGRQLTYLAAFNEGMHQLMAEDHDIFVAGEEVEGVRPAVGDSQVVRGEGGQLRRGGARRRR